MVKKRVSLLPWRSAFCCHMLWSWDICGRVHLPNLASGPDESISHPVPQRGVHIPSV